MSARTQPSCRLLTLTPADERILRVTWQAGITTTEDLTYWAFTPGQLTTTRARMARLAGNADYAHNAFLFRYPIPSAKAGAREKAFVLGSRGREFVSRELGLPVASYFRPYKQVLSYTTLSHALCLTRFVAAAHYWSRRQDSYTLAQTRLSYELARLPGLKAIPDAWLRFVRQDGTQFPLFVEICMATQMQKKFKMLLHHKIDSLASGQYAKVFGRKEVTIAYVESGLPKERQDTRRLTMSRWIMEVLTEQKKASWASTFRLTSVQRETLFTQPLFSEALWYRPDNPTTPIRLFAP